MLFIFLLWLQSAYTLQSDAISASDVLRIHTYNTCTQPLCHFSIHEFFHSNPSTITKDVFSCTILFPLCTILLDCKVHITHDDIKPFYTVSFAENDIINTLKESLLKDDPIQNLTLNRLKTMNSKDMQNLLEIQSVKEKDYYSGINFNILHKLNGSFENKVNILKFLIDNENVCPGGNLRGLHDFLLNLQKGVSFSEVFSICLLKNILSNNKSDHCKELLNVLADKIRNKEKQNISASQKILVNILCKTFFDQSSEALKTSTWFDQSSETLKTSTWFFEKLKSICLRFLYANQAALEAIIDFSDVPETEIWGPIMTGGYKSNPTMNTDIIQLLQTKKNYTFEINYDKHDVKASETTEVMPVIDHTIIKSLKKYENIKFYVILTTITVVSIVFLAFFLLSIKKHLTIIT